MKKLVWLALAYIGWFLIVRDMCHQMSGAPRLFAVGLMVCFMLRELCEDIGDALEAA